MSQHPRPLSVIDRRVLDGDGAPSPFGPHLFVKGSNGLAQAKGGQILDGLIDLLRRSVKVTITAAGGSGGATAGTLVAVATDLQDNQVDGAKQFLIIAQGTQYAPNATPDTTLTFGTETVGTIVAKAAGWALVQTDTTGNFACPLANSADETLYFTAIPAPAGVSVLAEACVNVLCVPDDATWAA